MRCCRHPPVDGGGSGDQVGAEGAAGLSFPPFCLCFVSLFRSLLLSGRTPGLLPALWRAPSRLISLPLLLTPLLPPPPQLLPVPTPMLPPLPVPTPLPPPLLLVQESTKTKHPQLLYESKIYKILQGGSESGWVVCVGVCVWWGGGDAAPV